MRIITCLRIAESPLRIMQPLLAWAFTVALRLPTHSAHHQWPPIRLLALYIDRRYPSILVECMSSFMLTIEIYFQTSTYAHRSITPHSRHFTIVHQIK